MQIVQVSIQSSFQFIPRQLMLHLKVTWVSRHVSRRVYARLERYRPVLTSFLIKPHSSCMLLIIVDPIRQLQVIWRLDTSRHLSRHVYDVSRAGWKGIGSC